MILDIKGAAKLLGSFVNVDGKPVSTRTVHRWIRERGVPAMKIGHFLRFHSEPLTKWAMSHKLGMHL